MIGQRQPRALPNEPNRRDVLINRGCRGVACCHRTLRGPDYRHDLGRQAQSASPRSRQRQLQGAARSPRPPWCSELGPDCCTFGTTVANQGQPRMRFPQTFNWCELYRFRASDEPSGAMALDAKSGRRQSWIYVRKSTRAGSTELLSGAPRRRHPRRSRKPQRRK